MIGRIAAMLALLSLPSPAAAQTRQDLWERCKSVDPDVAIGACTALIQSGTDTDTSLSVFFLHRGIAYSRQNDRERALKDYVRALSLDRTNADIYFNRGLLFVLNGEFDSALRDSERALQLQPADPRPYAIRGEVLRRQGRFKEATAEFDKALSSPIQDTRVDDSIRGVRALSEEAKRCGDADAGISIAACTAVINDRTMTPEAVANAYNTRAVAHGRNDNWEQAVRDQDESIRLNPSSAVFFANRGIASIRLENYGQAARDFERSLSLDPRGLAAINGQGLLARQLRDYAGAVERFTAAIVYTPEPPPDAIAAFLANRGMTYLLMEKYDEALIDLNRALSITPRSAFALFSRGVLRIRKGDVAGGEADIAAAKAAQSDIEIFMARRHLTR